jgi:ankyrin repeat protein
MGREEDLHAAARSGDLESVESITSSNPLTVNSRDKHSRTPLHLAAWAGNTEVVSYLCKNKADIGAAAIDDMGAIHFAAQKGHLEVIRILLSAGASVKSATRKGLTPLHFASQGSQLELAKYLVKKGASLRAKTKAGKTPLDLANKEEIISYLEECEESLKKGNVTEKETPVKSDPKPDNPPGSETTETEEGEVVDQSVKRKGDEDIVVEASSESKKARVALNHLLSADDDAQDEEENE